MKKIAIVTTYHGKFPNNIYFWFKSIEKNPTIDFFLFTDLEVKVSFPNLKVVKRSFNELIQMAQDNFDFKISVPRAYKYPDFRPAFGEIFAEFLKEYDFWGFSEQDLVYGDIRHFFTDELLEKYDKLLGNGHLTLYRNNPEVNASYKLVDNPTYKFVYTHGRNFYFEEYWGTSRYWDKNRSNRFYQGKPFDDVNYYRAEFYPDHGVAKDEKNIIYSFENGKVFRYSEKDGMVKKTECLYVHFQKRLMQLNTEVADYFTMIPDAYIPFIENVTLETLRKYGYSRCKYTKRYFQILKKEKITSFWRHFYPKHLD
ncbi:hypothetical protein L6472_10130 [Prevotella sp. E13-17]|uniref:DUF6625 family protein n=1 Tax=Prevotella sp. E13-17 TaxID=2913616 RepID=UPI001EDAB8DF|nr:DUF6625 family protein [Prevotella sp. E13-17]UKK50377.1 hypothetical protein L6472_10130 [Prevotella sp. E13-17]